MDSLALANVQLNLQAAYRNFFRDKKVGFPKFKSAKRSRKAYTTNNQGGTVALRPNGIRLPKIGTVRAVLHRLPEEGWVLKSATVYLESDGKYYASVLFEYEQHTEPVSIHSDSAIGLDYRSDGLYMDSSGHISEAPINTTGNPSKNWQKPSAACPGSRVPGKGKENPTIT